MSTVNGFVDGLLAHAERLPVYRDSLPSSADTVSFRVFDRALALKNHIDLIFIWVLNWRAVAVGINDCLTIARYADNHGCIWISLAKQRLVVARRGCNIGGFFLSRGGVAIKKSRVDLAFAWREAGVANSMISREREWRAIYRNP